MNKNKSDWKFNREAQRAFAKAYAEDMDNWSALREEQETSLRDDAPKRDAATCKGADA